MKKVITRCMLVMIMLIAVSCSATKHSNLSVDSPTIQSDNEGIALIQNQISFVELGMSKEQVRNILGEPWMIDVVAYVETWSYTLDTFVFSFLPKENQFMEGFGIGAQGGNLDKMTIITFTNGIVTKIEK